MLTADIAQFQSRMGTAKAEMAGVEGAGNTAFSGLASVGKIALLGIGAAAIGGGAMALKMGADFQSAMTQLVTGAGESRANIDLVSKGILKMAGDVGTSASDLAKGMYLIESAGFHGADALKVLQAAAEGAKVGNADLAVVANGVTSVMNAYKMPMGAAAGATSQLVAAVSVGKMHMEDFTAVLGTVAPIAASLKIPFDQVAGAISTMTAQGTDASLAATSLRFLMSNLAGPTAAAAKEMKGLGIGEAEIAGITKGTTAELAKLGLHTSEVADVLAHGGLVPAMKLITDAVGKQFPAGSAQYEAALKTAVGGTRGLTAALELSGSNAAVWASNVKTISGATTEAGNHVKGWGEVQGDFNQQVSKTVEAAKALGIEIGLKLIPYAQAAMHAIADFAGWLKQHQTISIALAAAIGGVLLVAIGAYTIAMISAAVATVAATWPFLLAAAAIAVFVGGLVWAYQNIKPLHDFVNLLVDAFQALFANVSSGAGVFVGLEAFLYKMGVSAETAGQMVDVLRFGFNGIVTAISATLAWVSTNWPVLISIILGPLGIIIAIATGHGDQLKAVFMNAWNAILTWLGNILPQIPGAIGFALGWALGEFVKWSININAWLVENIPKFIGAMLQFFYDLPEMIHGALIKVNDAFTRWMTGLVTWALSPDGIPKFIASFDDEMHKLPGQMLDIGISIVKGIWSGMESMKSWMTEQITNFGKGLASGFMKAISGGSPAMLFAPHGASIVEGIAFGIRSSSAAMSALQSRAGQLAGTGAGGGFSGGTAALVPAGAGPGGGGVTVIVQGNVFNWDQTAEALAGPVQAALNRKARNNPQLFSTR